MASFKKGEGGRPKGKPNVVTGLQREFIQSLLDDEKDKIKLELSKLTGKDYLNVVAGFMEFSIPKLQRTEFKSEGNEGGKIITGMVIL